MTTPINVIDSAIPIIASAVAEWKKKHTKEMLTRQVTNLLDKASQEIVMKLLGFDIGYGKTWELDHCNGRAGNSAAGDYLRKAQSAAITEWLSTVKLPTLSEAEQKKLTAEMKHDYEYALKTAFSKLILAKAEADAAMLMNKLTASKQLDNYLAAMKLVSGEENAS